MHHLFVRLYQVLPENIQDQADEIVQTVKANPTLLKVLIGVGAFCAAVFLFGIIKHAFKAAVLFAVLSIGAWIWYFNIR